MSFTNLLLAVTLTTVLVPSAYSQRVLFTTAGNLSAYPDSGVFVNSWDGATYGPTLLRAGGQLEHLCYDRPLYRYATITDSYVETGHFRAVTGSAVDFDVLLPDTVRIIDGAPGACLDVAYTGLIADPATAYSVTLAPARLVGESLVYMGPSSGGFFTRGDSIDRSISSVMLGADYEFTAIGARGLPVGVEGLVYARGAQHADSYLVTLTADGAPSRQRVVPRSLRADLNTADSSYLFFESGYTEHADTALRAYPFAVLSDTRFVNYGDGVLAYGYEGGPAHWFEPATGWQSDPWGQTYRGLIDLQVSDDGWYATYLHRTLNLFVFDENVPPAGVDFDGVVELDTDVVELIPDADDRFTDRLTISGRVVVRATDGFDVDSIALSMQLYEPIDLAPRASRIDRLVATGIRDRNEVIIPFTFERQTLRDDRDSLIRLTVCPIAVGDEARAMLRFQDCENAILSVSGVDAPETSIPSLVTTPNPAIDQLTVTSEDVLAEVRIVDALGRVWLRRRPLARMVTLDVSRLPAGHYRVLANALHGVPLRASSVVVSRM